MFAALLGLLPYLRPEAWPDVRVLQLLPMYTMHIDKEVREVAREAMLGMMKGSPHLRNSLLVNLAGFVTSMPDDVMWVSVTYAP